MNDQIDQAYEGFAASLDKSQWASREALRAHQSGLLARLARFAFAQSEFYRERLAPLFRSPEVPDLQAWQEVALLTRTQVADEIERINPRELPPDVGPVRFRYTSGTTNRQLAFRTCYVAQMVEGSMMHRLYRWHGLDLAATMASIRHYGSDEPKYPEGRTEPRWAFPGPQAAHHSVSMACSTEEMIEWLLRKRPRYLTTLPSVAQEIARHADAGKLKKLGIAAVVGVAEATTQVARAAVKETLGCDILEIYAAGEVGCIALRSPVDHSFLVCEENVLVEILDEVGHPVMPGQVGRVVVTGLYNYATPFIRYETGDYARLAATPCPTGRGLIRLERVEGRRRNSLLARNGGRVWLHDVLAGEEIRQMPVALFQIIQRDHTTVDVNYVPLPGGERRPDAATLAIYFSKILGEPIDVRINQVEAAPRSGGRKHEAVVSELLR